MPEFRPTHCTRYRYRYSACTRCSDACPHQAITLGDAGAQLDAARCRHCALCVGACPTQAWVSEDFKPIDLLREAIKTPAFSLACVPSGCRADAVVGCLGAIDAVWLAYMAKRGLAVTLHGSGHCAQCVHGATGREQWQLNQQALAVLHAAQQQADQGPTGAPEWLMPVWVDDGQDGATAPALPRQQPPAHARRRLFDRLFRARHPADDTAALPPKPTVIPAQAIRAGAYLMSESRELLQIVCKQKTDRPFNVTWHERLPLMQLQLHPGCTLCEACFRVCPTGAIQIEQNPQTWALTFQADRCVACEVCLEVCQPRVLDAQATFDARPGVPPLTLLTQAMQRCARCDRHFASPTPQKTCPVCSDDEDAFDQIFGA